MDCDGYPCVPMPLMCTAFVPGQIDAAVAGISDPNSRAIATAEALYFRGQATLAAEAARPYLDATDPALRYSACLICGYASLSLNRIADARRCLAGIGDTPTDEESPGPSTPRISYSSPPRASCCTCLPRIPPKSFIRLRRICPKACACSPAT